jgi:hypothetical protein
MSTLLTTWSARALVALVEWRRLTSARVRSVMLVGVGVEGLEEDVSTTPIAFVSKAAQPLDSDCSKQELLFALGQDKQESIADSAGL